MTHILFIAASYGLAIFVMGWFSIGAYVRLNAAKRRLAAIDTRRQR